MGVVECGSVVEEAASIDEAVKGWQFGARKRVYSWVVFAEADAVEEEEEDVAHWG